MTPIRTCLHALDLDDLPYPWAGPPRVGGRGYWMLGYGHTVRPLHRLAWDAAWDGWEPPVGCWWCKTEVSWRWVVDHVDANKDNNHPSNLVRACNRCNFVKGREWWGVGYPIQRLYRMPVREWEEVTYESLGIQNAPDHPYFGRRRAQGFGLSRS